MVWIILYDDIVIIYYKLKLKIIYQFIIHISNFKFQYIAIEYDNFNWNIVHAIVSSVIDLNMTDYEEKINIVKEGKFYNGLFKI